MNSVEQIQGCDAILARMQEMLLGFQADLGGISDEIKHLQVWQMIHVPLNYTVVPTTDNARRLVLGVVVERLGIVSMSLYVYTGSRERSLYACWFVKLDAP